MKQSTPFQANAWTRPICMQSLYMLSVEEGGEAAIGVDWTSSRRWKLPSLSNILQVFCHCPGVFSLQISKVERGQSKILGQTQFLSLREGPPKITVLFRTLS